MAAAKLRDAWELVKDGWSNVLSGIGGGSDKAAGLHYRPSQLIPRFELAAMYESEGLIGRIVDIVAEDMVRAGFNITGDEDGKLMKKLKDLHLTAKIATALKWMRLFGGALIVLDIKDGLPWDQPYDWTKGKPSQVRGIRVYSAARTIIASSDFVTDTTSSWFEDVERFTIKRLYGPTFQVHASRCIVLKGKPLPDTNELTGYDLDTRYWGLSVVQSLFQTTSSFGAFVEAIGHLGQEMVIGKYTISNLEDLVAENDWKSIRQRIRIIDESKSIIHAVLLGPTEKYERDSLTFTGVPEVLDRLMMLVSAYSDGIPVSRLFGRSSAGLNSNGDGDGRDYYDMIGSKQTAYLEQPLLQLIQMVNAGEGGIVNGDELGITFKPVWVPSQSDLITMRKTVADTDKIYNDMGTLDNEQIFNTRFKNGYSTEYQIEGDYEEPEEDPDMVAQLAALQAQAQGAPKDPNAQQPTATIPPAAPAKVPVKAPGKLPVPPKPPVKAK